jgi:membrane protein implicated in regulation of membrane protease activity
MDGLSSSMGVQFGIIALAAIVHASLQLEVGALMLLYHASLGKHIKKKTRNLVSSYILGSALLVVLFLSTIIFLIATLTNGTLSTHSLAILSAVLLMLALSIWLFYYRSRQTTELWLPKSISRYINRRAKLTESNIEAFSLGMLTAFAEMPFSFVLLVVSGNSIISLPFEWQFISVLGYAFISVLPLFILRISIRRGNTVVDVQRWRLKNKNFFKVLSGTLFLTLAAFLIAFKVLGA